MRFLRQTLYLLALLLGNHRARPRDAGLVCIGFVIAAATLSVMLAIPAGIDRISSNTGQPDIVMILSSNTSYETSSSLTPEQASIISQLPQIARGPNGRALVAPQFLANVRLTRPDGRPSTVMLRGVTADIWPMLDSAHIRTDIQLREGSRDLLASQIMREQFAQLRQPELNVRGRQWRVAGHLDTGGSVLDSELWTDLSALQAAYNRPSAISSLWVKLTSAEAIDELDRAIYEDRRLDGLHAIDQVSYFYRRVGNISRFTHAMAAWISVLLGVAACLVISGMLGIVLHHRRQQMATLRSLGFDRWAVGLANLLDVWVIGSVSALLTTGLVWWWLDGVSFGTANYHQAVYARFVIDAGVVLTVLGYSVLLGLLSTLIPLYRAMQGQLVTALQE